MNQILCRATTWFRGLALWTLLLTCPITSEIVAQDTTTVKAGQRVRVRNVASAPSGRITGLLTALATDSLGVTDERTGTTWRLARWGPIALDVFDGRRASKGKSAAIGAVAGALVLGVAGAVAGDTCSIDPYQTCSTGSAMLSAGFAGAAVGALVGTLIGIPKRDRWREIPRPWRVIGPEELPGHDGDLKSASGPRNERSRSGSGPR